MNPDNLKWHSNVLSRIKDLAEKEVDDLLVERDRIARNIFREHPFKRPGITAEEVLDTILDNERFSQGFGI